MNRCVCYCGRCAGKKRKLRENIVKDLEIYGVCSDAPVDAFLPVFIDPVQLTDEDFMDVDVESSDEIELDLSGEVFFRRNDDCVETDPDEAGPSLGEDLDEAGPSLEEGNHIGNDGNDCEAEDEDEAEQVQQYDSCKQLILDWFSGENLDKLRELTGNNEKPIFPGSKHSLFGVALGLIDLKVVTASSDLAFDMLLRFLASILPDGHCLPTTTKAMRRIVANKNIKYHAYDACAKDCVVYRGELATATSCPVCTTPRYKGVTRMPAKCIRHFPLIPVLQLEQKCPEQARLQKWHSTASSTDGKLRSIVDSKCWKDFHLEHPSFSDDPRNVHLSLWGDGVSPIVSKTARTYSCWPCGFFNLNIPPEMSIRSSNMYLSLIIPGPEQALLPDTYLDLIVEELLELWDGVPCTDSRGDSFTLRGTLMYTVHDTPGMTTLSGFSTKGHSFCYACGDQFKGQTVPSLRTTKYFGHRKFLPLDHELRRTNVISFNGQEETEVISHRMTSEDWLEKWLGANAYCPEGMTRLSVFYKLPYWANSSRRHLFDFMHIGKNVAATILQHITGEREATVIKSALQDVSSKQNLWTLETALPWVLSKTEAARFYDSIKKFKVPTAFAAHSLRDLISKHGLSGLTSHDYHHLLKDVMPIALTGTLTADVRAAINTMAALFKKLSCKELNMNELDGLKLFAVEAVCKLEMAFPVSIMTTQVHYLIHLAEEIELWGPCISMFPVERLLREFRKLSKQKVYIEASISEKWIERQVMVFATEYLKSTSIHVPQLWSIVESIPDKVQGGKEVNIDENERIAISNFLLHNDPEMIPCLEAYEQARTADPSLPVCCDIHWLRSYIYQRTITNRVHDIASGCCRKAKTFSGMWFRGKHFRPRRFDSKKQTMDRYVCCEWEGAFVAHRGDREPVYQNATYTGEIIDILEVRFCGWSQILFKVEWFKVIFHGRNQSPKTMENGLQALNTTQKEASPEYIYPARCSQCYLVEVAGKTNWSYIVEAEPRFRWIPRQNMATASSNTSVLFRVI